MTPTTRSPTSRGCAPAAGGPAGRGDLRCPSPPGLRRPAAPASALRDRASRAVTHLRRLRHRHRGDRGGLVSGRVQYGPGVKARAAWLTCAHFLPVRRASWAPAWCGPVVELTVDLGEQAIVDGRHHVLPQALGRPGVASFRCLRLGGCPPPRPGYRVGHQLPNKIRASGASVGTIFVPAGRSSRRRRRRGPAQGRGGGGPWRSVGRAGPPPRRHRSVAQGGELPAATRTVAPSARTTATRRPRGSSTG